MTINKNTDLEFSLQKGTEKGGVYTNFYTEDKGSASIRIRLSSNEYYLDLTKIDLKPVLFLFHEDGSIFEIRDFINVMPDKGLIQYNLSDNVIAHAGKVKAKLFLKNTEQSVHVANFTFDIKDSGIEGAIEKEISVNLVDDAIKRIIEANPDNFKGKDADPNDIKDLLIPYTESRVTEEFEKLSSAKQQDAEVIQARGRFDTLADRLNKSEMAPLKYGPLELPSDFKPTTPFTFYRDNDSIIKHNMDFQSRYKNGTKLYVRLVGDDSTGDGTPSKPYRTMTKAIDTAVKGSSPKYEIITNIPVFNRDEFVFNQTVTNKTIAIISEGSYDESAKQFINYNIDTNSVGSEWDTGVNEFIRTTTSGSSYTHRVYGSNITLKYRKDTNGGVSKNCSRWKKFYKKRIYFI